MSEPTITLQSLSQCAPGVESAPLDNSAAHFEAVVKLDGQYTVEQLESLAATMRRMMQEKSNAADKEMDNLLFTAFREAHPNELPRDYTGEYLMRFAYRLALERSK